MNRQFARKRRAKRVRSKAARCAQPGALRLSVFRSHKHIYAQLIDDTRGVTLFGAGTLGQKGSVSGAKTDKAFALGKQLGEQIVKGGHTQALYFDRGGYIYHGRIKALAEGVREAGVKI